MSSDASGKNSSLAPFDCEVETMTETGISVQLCGQHETTVVLSRLFEHPVKFQRRYAPDYYEITAMTAAYFGLECLDASRRSGGKCSICGETYVAAGLEMRLDPAGDRRYVCRTCIREYELNRCVICGLYHQSTTFVRHEGMEQRVCLRCIGKHFSRCDRCGTLEMTSHLSCTVGGRERFCRKCKIEMGLKMCIKCGYYAPPEHTVDGLCIHCLQAKLTRSQPEKQIYGYNHRPDTTVFLSTTPGDVNYLGIELEFQWGSGDNRKKILSALAKYDDFYLKEDGSVDHGAELVTYPATLAYHAMRFTKILAAMSAAGCTSHDTGDCGLHVHVNRGAFGANSRTQSRNIARFLYLFEHFRAQLKVFSRRELASKKDGRTFHRGSPYQYCEFYDIDRRYADTAVSKVYQTVSYHNRMSHAARYRVLNFQNGNTVEVRLFRGTLNYTTFVATLELVKLFCDIATSKLTDDEVKALQWSDICAKTPSTSCLSDYLKKMKLI